MTLRSLLLTSLLLTTPLALAPMALADDSCKNKDYGSGWESPECSFTCLPGDRFHVRATASNQNDYIDGWAQCGNDVASCSGSGRCYDADTATASATGECEANGYVGAWGWVEAYCWTENAEGARALLAELIQGPRTDASSAAVLPPDAPTGWSELVHIRMGATGAEGTLCQAGQGCLAFIPACVDLGEGRLACGLP